jgi:hypothetical protein
MPNKPIAFYDGPALGAIAGMPGQWAPPRATPPSTMGELNAGGVVPEPPWAWPAGQWAPMPTVGAAYWDGAAYVTYTATAGTPGAYNVAGFNPASSIVLRDMAVKASPATAWTVGQYVPTSDGQHAHWAGSAWVPGVA